MYSRLTTATMYKGLMNSLQQSQRSIQDLQNQIASGNKYKKLSDNPSAISRSLTVQSALNANDKYQSNTQNAVTMLRHADSALNNVLDAAQTIQNLIIEAGDAALNSSQLKDITAQIEANKKIMLDNLNTKIAGKYIFGGTDTSTPPFVEKSDGSIEYQGNDQRMKYAVSESLLGDISFAGSDIVKKDQDSYFICSHYVPMDWKWTGREEKVQITVGNRTLSVFIPEDWSDSDINKTSYADDPDNADDVNFTDMNGFRDSNELSGISLEDLVSIVNSSLEEQGADMLVKASIEYDNENGRKQLILKSTTGEKIGITGWPDTDYMPTCAELTSDSLDIYSGWNAEGSAITVSSKDGSIPETRIEIDPSDTPETVAAKLNAIHGVSARSSADGSSLRFLAERIGDQPADRLRINEAEEAAHYPSLIVKLEGGALKMFESDLPTDKDGNVIYEEDEDGNQFCTVIRDPGNRVKDQSHIDIFDYLGMETAIKGREFAPDEKLTVEAGTQLHWRITSGGKSVDIKLNPGEYTIEQIAERIQNASASWLEVTVGTEVTDKTIETGAIDETEQDAKNMSNDYEEYTKRLVIRGYNGEQVIFMDMNEYSYADKMGLSTALRTDAYDENNAGIGMKCVNFPSAPCVDDNIGIPMRVQMNCGMYYDINIKKADVVDVETGFVNRDKVMQKIVDEVNAQEDHDIMGFVQHVDSTGAYIEGSSSIYFLSGEAFTVVDMPFDDPEWNDYSGGIAAQMGIHGGVTSNMRQNHIIMRDDTTFGEAYDATTTYDYGNVSIQSNPTSIENGTFREGTIRFSNLAYSVDIDVSADDTVKDVMDRLRVQAGDWLYVNYYDTHMGQLDARNAGDFPLISISSKDGSAVNVLDIKGHVAEDALGISTGIQGRLNEPYSDSNDGIMQFDWDVNSQVYDGNAVTFPADLMNITVAGYTHTIDLTAIRDVTNDDQILADDIVEFVNSRMQDYDVQALINEDKELVVYSPRGYSVEISFELNGSDVSNDFLGNGVSKRTFYRGGYNLEGKSYDDGTGKSRGIEDDSLYGSGVYTQNATIRSGANTMRQNGFGVINDIMAAIESGNRDDLLNKMLPKMESFIDNILSVMAEDGALQARYNYNTERLIGESSIMTEEYDNLVKIDPADAISQLMIADYMYQANLAVIARLIQPSLLDFLG